MNKEITGPPRLIRRQGMHTISQNIVTTAILLMGIGIIGLIGGVARQKLKKKAVVKKNA